MRVVIDTNIFISGLFFGGMPRQILDFIQEKQLIPCFTVQTFRELQRLLNDDKFAQQRIFLSFSIERFLNQLEEYSLIFPQKPTIPPIIIKEDLADNYILACALVAQVSFIISGDRHLLSLKDFQGIPIISPKIFLKFYSGSA